jgi:uncharacterized protein
MPAIQPMPAPAGHLQRVQSYRAGGFTIGGDRHEGSVLVLPDVTRPWPAGSLEEIGLDSLVPILDAEPRVEILVVGAGARFAMVGPELRAALKARGIAVESMDTRAACRTFNVLLAEDRRVAAALIAI